MSVDLSLVVVTHRSANDADTLLGSVRRQESAVDAEIVVVDHSEDRQERQRLEALEPDVLVAQANRGYAAGVNAGIARARGRTLMVANPDLVFRPGSLRALVEVADTTVGEESRETAEVIVGPQFTLAGWLLPPAEPQTPLAELGRRLGTLGPATWRWRLRRRWRQWRRVWQATLPVEVPTLSGALLVFSRAVYERIGPWDEAYFLYFEETDWIARARALGIGCRLVPGARVEHAWGHSARPGEQRARFEASRRRYFERRYGWIGRMVRAMPGGGWRPPRHPWPPIEMPSETQWLVSPSSTGMPAALHVGPEPVEPAVTSFLEAAPVPEVTVLAVEEETERLRGPWRCTVETVR